MDARNRSVEAIVLKSAAYKEQDRLLTFISAEQGLGRAIAKGAAQANGKLRSVAQPYCLTSLELTPPRGGVSMVAGGLPRESFLRLDGELERFACAAYLCELTAAATVEGRSAPELFYPLLAALTLLKQDDDLARTTRFFELRLLAGLGLLPELSCCGVCGRHPEQGGDYILDPVSGQLRCIACAGDVPWPELSAGAVLTCRRLLELPLDRLPSLRFTAGGARESGRALEAYLGYHLDYASRVRQVARKLLE